MNWTQEEQIRYEAALDAISGLKGILSRILYWNQKEPILEENTVKMIKARIQELQQEWNNRTLFDGSNTKLVDEIISKYGNLNKRFTESYNKEDKKENHHFFDELLTTKVDYGI